MNNPTIRWMLGTGLVFGAIGIGTVAVMGHVAPQMMAGGWGVVVGEVVGTVMTLLGLLVGGLYGFRREFGEWR